MKYPGFTAEASLRSSDASNMVSTVTLGNLLLRPALAALAIPPGGGGLGFWRELGCGTAYALCLTACAALTGPAIVGCAALCTLAHKNC